MGLKDNGMRATGALRLLPALLLAMLLAGALTACTGANKQWQNDASDVADARRTFPYEVIAERVEIDVRLPVDGQPAAKTVEQLDLVFQEFLQSGGRVLAVSAPLGAGSREAADRKLAWMHRRALARGLLPQELDFGYRAADADAPLLLSYERYRVVTSDCGNFSKESRRDAANAVHSNFGCAYQHNLAIMAANPADLENFRPASTSDGERRGLVLRNYRLGQPTDSRKPVEQTRPPITRYGDFDRN